MFFRLTLAAFAAATFAGPALAQGSMSAGSMSSLRTMSDKTMPKCATDDAVVWVNTRLNVYFLKGSTYFGRTAQGDYECRSAAVKSGVQPSKSASMSESSTASAAPSGAPAGVGPSAGMPSAGPNPPQPRQSGTTSPEP